MSNQHHGETNGSNNDHISRRSSGQSRRGGSTNPHPRSQHGRSPQIASNAITSREDSVSAARKRIQHLQQKSHDKSGDDIRLRPQTVRSDHYSKHARNGSGSSTSSSKGPPQVDHSSSGSEAHGHSRHRNTSSSTDGEPSSKNSGIDKKERTNRFEKLSKLDPDSEQVVTKKTRDSSPGNRSAKGTDSLSKNHRGNNSSGPTRSKGNTPQYRKGQGPQSDNLTDLKSKKGLQSSKTADNGHPSKTTSKDVKRNYPQERKDSGIGCSPSSIESQNELESTDSSVIDLSNGAAGTDIETADIEKPLENGGEYSVKDEADEKRKVDINRIMYTRDHLLTLKKSPACSRRHEALGDSIDILFLKPKDSQQNTEPQTDADGKKKHPTALSLIREHDSKQLPKVSLSPQRRSFHSGCSWKETSNGTSEAPISPSSAKELSNSSTYFDFESPHPPASARSTHTSFQFGPQLSSRRVIDHVPIRDQELGRGDKRNWREKSKETEWKGHSKRDHYHNTWEDEEPEWMEFGPNDRFELIELKGMDEHEREREARLELAEPINPSESRVDEDNEDQLPVEHDDDSTGRVSPSDKSGKGESEKVVTSKEAEPKSADENVKKLKKNAVMLQAALEMDNEFMLDGFDFSTGLSICEELTRDEGEKRSAESTSEVSTALMKVLNIGGMKEMPSKENKEQAEKRILGMSSRPVNALTLDEIHARENIQPAPAETTTNKPSLEDLGAFNKLVAGLQSSGVLQTDSEPPQHQPKPSNRGPSPGTMSPIPMPNSPVPVPGTSTSIPVRSTAETAPPPQNAFGNMLENELDFDEEVITGARPHFHPPPPQPREREIPPQYPSPTMGGNNAINLSRLEHLERMLEKLDTTHQHMLRDRIEPRGYSGQLQGAGYPEPHMKQKVPREMMAPSVVSSHGGSVRMTPQQLERPVHTIEREYVYPEAMTSDPRMDMRPPPQHHGGGMRHMGGMNRPNANNWAIEMERRRVYELKQMERARIMERERMYEGNPHGGAQHKMPPSKPNISLLPTAVMRQMHNSKPNQSLSEVAKNNSAIANRLDQELTSKASLTHSSISNMLNEPEHPPPRLPPSHMYQSQGGMGGQMRSVPSHPPIRPVNDPAAAAMMYQRYHNMPVMPHGGMQNPYMY